MNFRLKSWDFFSWTAMRGGLFRLNNDFTAAWALTMAMTICSNRVVRLPLPSIIIMCVWDDRRYVWVPTTTTQ